MSDQTVKRDPSCIDDFDPGSISVEEALGRIEGHIEPVAGTERVPVRGALNRVLARPVASPFDVPGYANSAMDGYAVRAADLPGADAVNLRVMGTAWAGAPFAGHLAPGQCVRIMTGAKLPEGSDTVVMQEHVERTGERVRVGPGHRPGQNVRHPGEDIGAGTAVLDAGCRLTPSELGLIASLGIAEVTVKRRVRVAFFSTGDELRSIGEPLGEGELYDSNRYTLHGMLARLGVEVLDMGVVRDRREDVEAAFGAAADAADAIITSGGVSVGEADYVTETLQRLGEVNFWKIAMKPGRPLAFGRVAEAWFFGLPGNPVSVMVTFYQFVQPALRRLAGETPVAPKRFRVPAATPLRKRPGRVEFQRGVLVRDEDGRLTVHSTGLQGSHVLSGMSRANCFIVLPLETGDLEAGAEVEVEPFEGIV